MLNPNDPNITHEEAITEHLLEHGTINKEEAFNICGCEDLKSTIRDMRKKGWRIATHRITTTYYELEAPPAKESQK